MKPIIKCFSDGSRGKINRDGSWQLKLANGLIHRDQAKDEERALTAIERIHTSYVMQQWRKGRSSPGGAFLVPLR